MPQLLRARYIRWPVSQSRHQSPRLHQHPVHLPPYGRVVGNLCARR
jgi:hypothetical protein